LILTGGNQISGTTFGHGRGGQVWVTATETLTLAGTNPAGTRPSGMFARTLGTDIGARGAGSVAVQASRVALTAGAQISSETLSRKSYNNKFRPFSLL
jgi:hypothetical protein